jgi:hypothetical protein
MDRIKAENLQIYECAAKRSLRAGRPDEFVKKMAQNVAQNVAQNTFFVEISKYITFTVKESSPKFLATFVIFNKTSQGKRS